MSAICWCPQPATRSMRSPRHITPTRKGQCRRGMAQTCSGRPSGGPHDNDLHQKQQQRPSRARARSTWSPRLLPTSVRCSGCTVRHQTRQIADYVEELITLLAGGYVDSVEYGFKRANNWAVALRYTANSDGTVSGTDDRPGRVPLGDVQGTGFGSFLVYSSKWSLLSTDERGRIERTLPFVRTSGSEPGGAWSYGGKTYSRDGVSLRRGRDRAVRPPQLDDMFDEVIELPRQPPQANIWRTSRTRRHQEPAHLLSRGSY